MGPPFCISTREMALLGEDCHLIPEIQAFFESEEGQWEQNNIKQD